MNSKLLTVIGVGTVAFAMTTNDASALEYKEGTVTANVLNVRSGPSVNNGKIGSVSKGAKLEILDTTNGWYKVKLSNGKEGWVSGTYLTVSNKAVGTTTIKKAKVTANVLNIRSGIGTNYSIVSKVEKNNEISVLDSLNGWYKVRLSNGKEGWCSGQYLTILNTTEITQIKNNTTVDSTNKLGVQGKVSATSLNVRSGIGINYSVVGKLTKDTVVDLLDESNGWYKVKLPNGVLGWCSGSYISKLITVNDNNSSSLDVCPPPIVNENTITDISIKRDAILNIATSQLGKPYVYGAEGPNSFDCSGFTYFVYKNAVGVTLPRVSKDQAKFGQKVDVGNFEIGDLVYLDTSGSLDGVVSHVGIYIGNGEMIHASGSSSNPRYVMVTKIDSGWYKDRVLGGRRFI